MQTIEFDSGMEEFRLSCGGVLRFNPADPNLYARFLESEDKLDQLEKALLADARAMEQENAGKAVLVLLHKADWELKNILGWVFGEENDFHALLGGVNLLAVAGNGRRVVENLFSALEPVLEDGISRCARQAAQQC